VAQSALGRLQALCALSANEGARERILITYNGRTDMATIFELITMLAVLALGFVLGRIFEIRRELQRDQRIANGRADRILVD
jgi:hypothetical protein